MQTLPDDVRRQIEWAEDRVRRALRESREDGVSDLHLLVCGSRGFSPLSYVRGVLERQAFVARFIVGDAGGADWVVREYAAREGIECDVFAADWTKHGKAAGPIRNALMVAQRPDRCLAFWDGKSRGTLNTIALCTQAGIPVWIYPPRGGAAGNFTEVQR